MLRGEDGGERGGVAYEHGFAVRARWRKDAGPSPALPGDCDPAAGHVELRDQGRYFCLRSCRGIDAAIPRGSERGDARDRRVRSHGPVRGGNSYGVDFFGGAIVAMESSGSCFASTGLGASVIRSVPDCFLGKAMTSRMDCRFSMSMTMRSTPSAMPPTW